MDEKCETLLKFKTISRKEKTFENPTCLHGPT